MGRNQLKLITLCSVHFHVCQEIQVKPHVCLLVFLFVDKLHMEDNVILHNMYQVKLGHMLIQSLGTTRNYWKLFSVWEKTII